MVKVLIELFGIKNPAFFIKHGADNCNILARYIMPKREYRPPSGDKKSAAALLSAFKIGKKYWKKKAKSYPTRINIFMYL